jgi:hypothetical protein
MRNTGVSRAGLEDIGVRARQHIGHHATRREAHDVDAVAVGSVPINCVVYHADDTKSITTGTMSQASGVLHIPAVAHVRSAGVDKDEAMSVSVLRQPRPAEPLLSIAAARMQLNIVHVSLD